MNTDRRLARSSTDRVLAGVCGGIANYLNVDPTFVRLAFVLLVLFAGFSPLLYLILWVIMPSEDTAGQPYSNQLRDNAADMGQRFGEIAGQVSNKVGQLLDTSKASTPSHSASTPELPQAASTPDASYTSSTPEAPYTASTQQYTMPKISDDRS